MDSFHARPFRSAPSFGQRRLGHRPDRRALRTFETLEPRWVCYAAVGEGEASPAAMPDFALVDVNPISTRYQQSVSPRDYLEQVSGWYFGHAT